MTFLPLAALVSPLLLYAGAASASIPVLIHLLNKRRFRRVRWAATQFLLEADRRNRRRVRIEELILLGMRCLAMFLLGVMLSRWFIRPDALMALVGSAARTERIIVIDDSFSMGLRDRSGPGIAEPQTGAGHPDLRVFDRARAATERLVLWLQQEAPADSLTIMLASRPEQPLLVEPAAGRISPAALEAELAALQPSSRAGNLPAAFASVRRILDSRSGAVSASVYVVSDFQEIDWSPGERNEGPADRPTGQALAIQGSAGAARTPADPLMNWAGPDRHLRLVLMDAGISSTDNLCVAAIEPQQSQFVAGVSGGFNARVVNFGAGASEPVRMQVYIGDAAQPEVAVPSIGPGETVDVPLEITFPHEGSETLTVQIEFDALQADDTRSLAVPVARALRILLVNGKPSHDPYQDEVHLLNVALRPEGPQFSGNDVTIVDENEFETIDLAEFHAVVLANVYRASEDVSERLEAFVETGGGVMFFLGDQIDSELYNRTLYREGRGLLPARLRGVEDATGRGAPFGEPDLSHPALRRFRDSQVPYLQGVVATRFFAAEPGATAGEGGPSPTPAPADEPARGPARVLLSLENEERSPLLIERTFGSGRVLMMTTTADKEWTNLPDRPVFVVLAMELIQYIARPAGGIGEQLVGEPIRLGLDPSRYQPVAVLKLPTFPEEPAVRIEAQPEPETGIPTVTWNRTDAPGVYRFELFEHGGAEAARNVAVNVDPRESDLRRASRAMLLEAMGDLPVEYVSGDQLVQEGETQARRELWPALLVAVLMVLMSEQAVAWWFGRDRSAAIFSRSSRP